MPQNAAIGRRYSRFNLRLLWCAVIARGFGSQGSLTLSICVSKILDRVQ